MNRNEEYTARTTMHPYIKDGGDAWISIEIEGLPDTMNMPLPDASRFARTILDCVNHAEKALEERQAHE